MLVSGCQRSGTTLLCEIINRHPRFRDYGMGYRNRELAAAMILAGRLGDVDPAGRYCFQTTYLNENYHEYFLANCNFRLIWIVRNPFSVVYSMMYNWRTFALNELFLGCGTEALSCKEKSRVETLGAWSLPKLRRACHAYNAKAEQAEEVAAHLGSRTLFVDYDSLIEAPETVLPIIFEFAGEPYGSELGRMVHRKSAKKAERLTAQERAMVDDMCTAHYERIRALTGC